MFLIKSLTIKSIKNKYFFFLLRIIKDLANPTIWPISKDMHSSTLGDYYFVFEESKMVNQKGGQKSIIFDKNGIVKNPTYIDVKDEKYVYFPITIGQVGLAIYHTYLKTKSEKDKLRFLNYADWFYNNAKESPELGTFWLTNVPLPQYKNPGPWQSAFVQSRAISILLRTYQLTGEKKYADMAEKALIPYTKPVSEGGVTSYTPWGSFYEEYTSSVPTLVLNGKIFAMCGLYDFLRVFPENQRAVKLFNDGIETLKNILPEFDMDFWSRYNLCKAPWYPESDPATRTYQYLHITQLKMLEKLTGEEIFTKYRVRFEKQNTLVNAIRMYFEKFRALKKLGRL